MVAPIIDVEQGKIQGSIERDVRDGLFYSFKGIPYAKPPTGELRFKAPVPADPWAGIHDGTKDGNPSLQPHPVHEVFGSEDCLHLSIYTTGLPLENQSKRTLEYLKPVMVWVHGGGYIIGSNRSNTFGPQFLLAEDVVLVTVNYRLGLLGFLSCEDDSLDVPGNAAFKDIVLALKWIQKNISQFLGDPNNITLFGSSAGANAVDCMVLSPMAKGLFHKVILQSCSALNTSLYCKSLKELAKDLGYENSTERVLLDILKKLSAKDLLSMQQGLEELMTYSQKKKYVGISIEKPSKNAFFTDSPLNILKSGNYNKVPMIVGYNTVEGKAVDMFLDLPKQNIFWKNKKLLVSHFLNLEEGSPSETAVSEKVASHYFGNGEMETFYENLYKFTRDLIVGGILCSVKNYVNTSTFPVYLYRFDMATNLNAYKYMLGLEGPGAYHADELGYLFVSRLTPEIKPRSPEDEAQRRVGKLWTNFARYGNPTPIKDPLWDVIWKPTDNSLCYLHMSDTLKMDNKPETEVIENWNKVLYGSTNSVSKL